jgi:hypothetical protein
MSYDYMVGTDERQDKDILSISPNPMTNYALIDLPDDVNGPVFILDNNGNIVREFSYAEYSGQNLRIKWDKGNLPAGVYYLVVTSAKGKSSEKFIIL